METNRIVIDTDILIDLLRHKTKVVNSLSQMETKGYSLATTTINAFELFYGAYKSKKREKNVDSTKTLLKRLIILTMELASAQNAGRIYTELEKQGEPIGLRDVMIGAIAITKGYRLGTRNIEHFQKIKGLNLIPIP